jgi:peptidyl-prolyl cis-trans isomerase A (cyclophilin A)
MQTLLNPELAVEKAPEIFKIGFKTTKGDFTVEVTRAWAPLGADRFYNLVKAGYFTDIAFFRIISGFMAQFGIHGDPAVSAKWRDARINDDAVRQSNIKGYISYAMAGPNTRTTQFFINYGDNARLDGSGFSPFGRVISGMEVVESLYAGYGEGTPSGQGPDQGRVQMQGNAYLKKDFPQLDYINGASLE